MFSGDEICAGNFSRFSSRSETFSFLMKLFTENATAVADPATTLSFVKTTSLLLLCV